MNNEKRFKKDSEVKKNHSDGVAERITANIDNNTRFGLFGNLDSFDLDGIKGWIMDAGNPDTSVNVTVYIGTIAISSTIANIYRPDVSNIVQYSVDCGFLIKLDKSKICNIVIDTDYVELDICVQPLNGKIRKLDSINLLKEKFNEWLDIPSVIGNIDNINDEMIATGWAISSKQKNYAKVELLINNIVVAKGDANLLRLNLTTVNPSLEMSGFKIKIPESKINNLTCQVDAKVDGVRLNRSPIKIEQNKNISIAISEIENGELIVVLDGWIGGEIIGELYVDGKLVDILALNGKKNDFKNCKGIWKLPEYLIDGQPHVYVFTIREKEIIVRSNATIRSYPRYRFNLDVFDFNRISGWSFRDDDVEKIHLGLMYNKKIIQKTFTNISRLDVNNEMKLNSKMKVGFDFNLESIGYEDSIEFEIVDLKTDIVIANILAVNTYESIIKFIQKNKNNSKESKLLLSKIILESNGSIAYSTKKLPRIKYPESNNEITVIIPVYSGILETIECLESVFLAKNITPNQVVIINDCTPDPLIQNYLDKIEQKNNPSVIIINKNKNGGFSESVNMGMIVAGSQDVILLNSDTVVQDEWIDRIIAIAKMDTKIGTITPMSNNAEICTVPYMCKSLPINCSELAKSVDIVAKNVNSGKIIDIPVAVGFCMYIRRECIEEIGLFDAATWGRGYGEEVDFCLKASSKGWRHVMACDTFIVHRGGISFGDEKLERIRESSIKITERYPFYNKVIQRFITNDPVQINRRNINVELINKSLPSKRILHITHTFGGGTQQYINDIMILNTEDGYTPLILAFRENGECELIFDLKDTVLLGFYINEHVEKFIANEFDCLKETLLNLNIDKIHIHAPFGIEFNLLNWFKETYLYDITIHDYAWICPRVTLTVDAGKYCGEPSVDKCNQCVKFYKPHIGLKNILNFVNGNVMQYRENFKSLIKKADTIFVGTNDVKIRMEKHGMIGNYHVTPHPVTINSIFSKSINLSNTSIDDGIIKVALFGAISDIKGFYVLVECAENALKKKLPIHFIVFGHTMNDELCRSYSNIEIIGKYLDDDLERMVKQYRPHVSFFPSQWPETFSYTLSHSLRFGIYPIVSDIGAQSERVKNIEFGYVFDGSLPASTICEMLIKQALNILDI